MRKVVRAIFDNPHDLTSESVAKSEELRALIKSQIVESIKLAFDANKTYASVFEINDSSHYIEIHKKHWVQALETSMLWYVEDENYEKCKEIKELIYKIKNKGSKGINLNDNDGGEGF
jgi:excinuclease UvrABC helicase subunit UvrB